MILTKTTHKSILSFFPCESYQKVFYKRSILDALGTLGGAFGIQSDVEYIIVSKLSNVTFFDSVLSSLYQVDTIGCQIDHDNNDKSYFQEMKEGILKIY